MSFVEQEDIFNIVEKLMVNYLNNFQKKNLRRKISRIPFGVDEKICSINQI